MWRGSFFFGFDGSLAGRVKSPPQPRIAVGDKWVGRPERIVGVIVEVLARVRCVFIFDVKLRQVLFFSLDFFLDLWR